MALPPIAFDPISLGASIGVTLLSGWMSGSKMSEEADRISDIENRKLAIAESELALGRPTREVIAELGPALAKQLGEFALGGVDDPTMQLLRERSTKGIASSLATHGLVDSSVFGEAIGEAEAGLQIGSLDRRLAVAGDLLGKAGFGGERIAGSLFGQVGGVNKPATISPVANLLGDLGEAGMSLASIPLLQRFGKFGNDNSSIASEQTVSRREI